MTQHVDEVARAIRRNKFERLHIGKHFDDSIEPTEAEMLEARAAMRAVVKHMREHAGTGVIRDFIDAYEKECGI